jgi:hypothetical protein
MHTATTAPAVTSFVTKLGTNKGAPRSRIWIEGARLAAAGFTVGVRYNRDVSEGCIVLTLAVGGRYKVAGKGSHPIIDTTGKDVLSTFPTSQHVIATYAPGCVTFTSAE